ncbi:hypothetical protein ACI3LZ_000371 [Candidozyma auris]
MASRKRWGRRCNDTKPVCVLTGASWVANHPHERMQAIETPSPRVTVACYIYAATVAMVNFAMANGVAVEGKPVGALGALKLIANGRRCPPMTWNIYLTEQFEPPQSSEQIGKAETFARNRRPFISTYGNFPKARRNNRTQEMARFVVYATFFVSPLGSDSIFPIETSAQEEWFDKDNDDRFKHDKRLTKRTTATPIKMTAEQKEAQIMNEIRKNNAKFEPRSLFGKIFPDLASSGVIE